MNFHPKNRFILVSEVTRDPNEPEIKPTVLLPEGYSIKTNPYGVYKIQQLSEDCTKVSLQDVGKLVMVNDAMVETASLPQGDFLLVLENHVYGILQEG
ncbi:MAG: hypothetical protein GOVbin630_19 [Prokaryotic dsDNA virus sp.]|nr:MAG: hypothetical protein GOVbin630_19 [Prokaryotic dsDNA virus sp.]|tara:strand:- start:12649 stop:12942 length:294 start_codon:yes stop_codon:yes gene_type:complete